MFANFPPRRSSSSPICSAALCLAGLGYHRFVLYLELDQGVRIGQLVVTLSFPDDSRGSPLKFLFCSELLLLAVDSRALTLKFPDYFATGNAMRKYKTARTGLLFSPPPQLQLKLEGRSISRHFGRALCLLFPCESKLAAQCVTIACTPFLHIKRIQRRIQPELRCGVTHSPFDVTTRRTILQEAALSLCLELSIQASHPTVRPLERIRTGAMTDMNDIFQPDKTPDFLTAVTEQESNATVGHAPAFDGQSRAAPVVATRGCFFYTECANGSSARGFEFGSGFGREGGT